MWKTVVFTDFSTINSLIRYRITELILLKQPQYFCLATLKSILKLASDVKYRSKYFTSKLHARDLIIA